MNNYNYIKNYHATAYTNKYIIGVEEDGLVYAYIIELSESGLNFLFSDKPQNSKDGIKIKYRSNKDKRKFLLRNCLQAFTIATIAEFTAMRRTKVNRKGELYTENKGECFEWLISEYLHGTQNDKSNVSYQDGGDITVNGVHYQVKYESATIIVG